MNKLLATLLASVFAISGAFAASHVGAPMAGASAPMAGSKMDKMDNMDKKPMKHMKHKKHRMKKADKAMMDDKK